MSGEMPVAELLVAVADDLVVDASLFDATVKAGAARRGWNARIARVPVSDLGAVLDAAPDLPALLVPGPSVDAAVLPFVDRRPSAPIVRYDLGRRPRDADPRLLHHLAALGLDHLAWAVLAAIDAGRHPAERVAYGADPDQYVEVRRPRREPTLGGPAGAVVLLHGGFYRSRWQASLMDDLAIDLADAGLTAVNAEYRRPDLHPWSATVDDVAAAVAAASQLAPGPLVVVGHSAGAQLALQVAERMATAGRPDSRSIDSPAGVALAVSLTGTLDLVEADARFMGEGAVAMALGGRASDLSDVYAEASPMAVVANTVPWLLVETDRDSIDFREMSRRLARSATGPVELLEGEGDHFTVLDAESAIWSEVRKRILAAFDGDRDSGADARDGR